ncbi:DUF2652 domain-containing protein [Reichenbachiella sp.]|uniref:DUF2652 domain-containing protein n=1 Tax=Reichenbachiella sp. TaxID=2184521 RepID=UPI003BAF3240
MSNHSFFFIPDISGFTSFVKKVEVEHSQHIIAELLELIIDSNQIGLSLAEVEGDAVFFYQNKEIPTLDQILKQVETTYLAFHNHLKRYETQRICPCGACSAAVDLQLKFIADTGASQMIEVKGNEKPFGESVIRVHRLLKNSVLSNEYLLLTEHLLKESPPTSNATEMIQGEDSYEELGDIQYRSLNLDYLQKSVSAPPQKTTEKLIAKPVTYTIDIRADKFLVFEWLTNMDRRALWNKDVNEFKYKKGIVNQKGYQHVCVIGNQTIGFETVTHDFGEGKLVYGEKTQEIPIFREATSYLILEESEGVTTIQVEFHYQEKPILGFLFKRFLIQKLLSNFEKNLTLLKELIESESQ